MTSVVIVIGVYTVSDDTIDVDIRSNKLTQIGTCEILLDNIGDKWGNHFDPNDEIEISIGPTGSEVLMFVGFVDDVIPKLDKKGVAINQIVVKGRNHGRYLTDFYYTKNYKEQASADIIDDILDGVDNPLLYNPPAGSPSIKYNCQRTKLGDAFNEISSLVGWDYYIDITGRLHYFVVGDPAHDSGVLLKSIVGDTANNLLSFEEYEEIGFDIKNKIEIHAGSVKDHWTEETATSWIWDLVGATTVIDETTIFMYGAASLKAVADGPNVIFGMDFTGDLHGYTTIDMTKYGQAKVVFIPKRDSTGDFWFRPVLVDGDGDVIVFTRNSSGQGAKGFTEEHNAFGYRWRTLSFPIGEHARTEVQPIQKSGWWHYNTRDTISFAGLYTSAALVIDGGEGRGTITANGGTPYADLVAGENIELKNCEDGVNNGNYIIYSVTDTVITLTRVLLTANVDDTSINIFTVFNWDNVVKIGFQLKTVAGMDTIFIDALYLPSVQAKCSTTEDVVGSQASYGVRMLSEYRKQLQSQKELDDYAAKVLAFRKDPIQKFKAVAKGQTGTKYVSQIVNVQAPSHGIDIATEYIIVTLHHSLHNNRTTRGWDFITRYDLVRQDTDPNRVLMGNNYFQAYLLQQAREAYERQHAIMDDEFWLGDIQTGITPQITRGASFPTDMNHGDELFLTADLTVEPLEYYGPALYRYDEDEGDWLRDPMVMHRADDPPAGGEVIYDTLHRIDEDKWYRWDGSWTLINFAAGTISGRLSSSQLKKGIQPFDSAVFFYAIRTAASDTVTFDIDVNNGAGGADIDASAGTPFDVFTPGDELIIQGCEDDDTDSILHVIDTVNGGGSGITLTAVLNGTDNADDETCIVSARDAIRWVGANPAIWFGDGTNRQIVTGDVNGLALGSHWIYFSTEDTDAHTTNTYATAVGDTVGIICRLEITSDSEPLIMPVYSRGGSMTLDFLGAGAVDTIVLTSDAIIGKDFRTAANVGVGGGPAGIRFDADGIYGYSGGTTQTFYIHSVDGKAYAGAGAVILDASGIVIKGQKMEFQDAGGTRRGTMFGEGTGALTIFSENWILLSPGANGVKISLGPVFAGADGVQDLGKVGTRWHKLWTEDGDFEIQLTIPRYNGADPGAPANGDIWLRTDL